MASKWTRHARRGAVHSAETWEGDRRPTSITLQEGGEKPISPDVVLWADADGGVVVGQDLLMPDAPPEAIIESLQRAVTHPGSGLARRPRRLRVSRPEIARVMQPVTQLLGIDLELVDSLPFVDDLFRSLEARLGSPANQGYLDATDMPEPVLRDLFAAAAAFYRARPWKLFTDTDRTLLRCEAWTTPYRYAVVLGRSGELKGLALYESWGDLERASRIKPDSSDYQEKAFSIPLVTLVFERSARLGPHRIEEVKAKGWEIASPRAYPLAVGIGRRRESHWPTLGEVRMLIAVMRALVPYLRALDQPSWMPVPEVPFPETYRVPVAGEDLEVTILFSSPRWTEP